MMQVWTIYLLDGGPVNIRFTQLPKSNRSSLLRLPIDP
jgi:hypothetical protein